MCNAVFFFCAVIPACHLRCLAQCLCPATAGCEHLHFFPSFLVHRVVIWYMCSSSIRRCSSSSSDIPPPSSSSRLRSPFGSGFSHGTRVQDVGRRRLRARAGHLRSNHVHVFHVEGPAASNFASCAHAIDRSVAASAWKVTAGAGAARPNPVSSQTFAPTREIQPKTDDVHVQSAFRSPFERLDSPWFVYLFFFRLAQQLRARRNGVCSSANHVQARFLAHESPSNTFYDAKSDRNSRRSHGTCSAAAAAGEPAGFRHRFAHRPPFVPLFFHAWRFRAFSIIVSSVVSLPHATGDGVFARCTHLACRSTHGHRASRRMWRRRVPPFAPATWDEGGHWEFTKGLTQDPTRPRGATRETRTLQGR